MDLQEIKTVEDLLQAVDEYLKTPRFPPIKGAELNTILSKAIKILVDQISLGTKTFIPVGADFSLNWQTDIIPGDTRTYASKHGNTSFQCQGLFMDVNSEELYSPSVTITRVSGLIDKVQFTGVFRGIITII